VQPSGIDDRQLQFYNEEQSAGFESTNREYTALDVTVIQQRGSAAGSVYVIENNANI